jgi:hypothetical protein
VANSDIATLTHRDFDDFIKRDDLAAKMAFRAAFRRSLYLVSKVLVAWSEPRNLMAAVTFKERQDWLQWVVCDHKRGLCEDPRGYIKSSGCTRSVPIFCAIQWTDDERDHPAEVARASTFLSTRLHLRGADSRLLILGDTESNAARFTASTLNIINTNPLYRWLYDELIWPNPNRRAYKCEYSGPEWTLNGRRNVTMADSFVRAAGAETAIVGGRADGEIFNDLLGEHNYKSRTEVARQRDFVKTAPFLLENRDPQSPEGGFVIVEGNRWQLNDVNSLIHDEYPDYAIWRRGVFRCYVHGLGSCGRWGAADARTCGPTTETIWPERHADADAIARLERDINDPAAAAAQLHNDPTAAADLDPAKMLPFYIELRNVRDHRDRLTREWCAIVANAVDGVRGEEAIPLATMQPHIVSVDPAASAEEGSARTAIIWYARDPITGRRFVNDCVADRWAADSGRAEAAIVDMVVQIADRARISPTMVKIVIERVAAQGYLGSAVKHEAEKRRIRVAAPILAKPAKGMAKIDRDRRMVGYPMSQNLLYVRDGLALIRTEARHFPTGTLDTLDAIAQAEIAIGNYRGNVIDEERAQARRAARERRLAASTVTGAPL